MLYFLVLLTLGGLTAVVLATLQASVVGRGGFPFPPDDRRIGCIDGLRGYLALSVLIHHFFIWTRLHRMGGSWEPPPINVLNQLGAGGVALFFMTTGLVFYPRILTGFRLTDWPTVYVTRAFRILPLVVVAVGIVTLIVILRTKTLPDWHYILQAAKWVSTWSEPPLINYPDSGRINAYVLWSLWYEWVFYLSVLPACAFAMDFVRSRALPSWAVPMGLLGASLVGRLALTQIGLAPGILLYLPLFAVGMLAFEAQARPSIRAILSKPVLAIPAVGLLLVGMFSTPFPYSLSLPLFGFFFVCIACGNSLGGILRTRGALVLGECSFGIYLLHGIFLNILFVDLHAALASLDTITFPALLPILAFVIVLVTPVTYLWVERPAMRQGRVLANWFTGRRTKRPDLAIGNDSPQTIQPGAIHRRSQSGRPERPV